jgi:hypothetical protein
MSFKLGANYGTCVSVFCKLFEFSCGIFVLYKQHTRARIV